MARLLKWLMWLFITCDVAKSQRTSHTSRGIPCMQPANCSCKEFHTLQVIEVFCELDRGESLEIKEETLPMATSSLTILGGSSVELFSRAFSNRDNIRRVNISGVHTLRFLPGTFETNDHVSRLHFDVRDGQVLEIKKEAFTSFKTAVTMEISNFSTASVGETAFASLNNFHIRDVDRLTISKSSFHNAARAKVQYHHGPALTVTLEGVSVHEVPTQAFGTSFAMVRFERVQFGTVRRDAFTGMQFSRIVFCECYIDRIEEGAFASPAHIMNMEIRGSIVQRVAGGGIASGVSNLTIFNSTFRKISSGAINISSASIRIEQSVFDTIETKGIEIRGWNSMNFMRNKFGIIEKNAIVTEPFDDRYSFNFIDNQITNAANESLKFLGNLKNGIYKNILFNVICHCNSRDWLYHIFGTYDENFYEMSYCNMEDNVRMCFNLSNKSTTMQMFTRKTCSGQIFPCFPAKSVSVMDPIDIWKTIKKYVCSTSGIIVIICLILMLALFFCFAMSRSYRTRFKDAAIFFKSYFIGLLLCVTPQNNVATPSQSELSAFNYCAETRCNNLARREQAGIGLSTMPLLTLEKATQSLPEELTEELLDNLKTKLDDPSTYEEARETINHLYKMIMVEESCNTNGNEEHIYDLPGPPIEDKRVKGPRPATASVGTRVPSLDKLQPVTAYERGALCREYFEPLDLAAHIYAEICGHRLGSVPDVLPRQAAPRGPFLRAAMRPRPGAGAAPLAPRDDGTLGSETSTSSGRSMLHRPLPAKPPLDHGEGTSHALRN